LRRAPLRLPIHRSRVVSQPVLDVIKSRYCRSSPFEDRSARRVLGHHGVAPRAVSRRARARASPRPRSLTALFAESPACRDRGDARCAPISLRADWPESGHVRSSTHLNVSNIASSGRVVWRLRPGQAVARCLQATRGGVGRVASARRSRRVHRALHPVRVRIHPDWGLGRLQNWLSFRARAVAPWDPPQLLLADEVSPMGDVLGLSRLEHVFERWREAARSTPARRRGPPRRCPRAASPEPAARALWWRSSRPRLRGLRSNRDRFPPHVRAHRGPWSSPSTARRAVLAERTGVSLEFVPLSFHPSHHLRVRTHGGRRSPRE